LELLPFRVSKVIGGLTRSDVASAKDAVVSLKVTSAMVGAVRLEDYCRQLEDILADRKLPDAASVFVGMTKTSRLIAHAGGSVQAETTAGHSPPAE
jgi:HPt (histidine-containing phosphotransfer) domain-containing protein